MAVVAGGCKGNERNAANDATVGTAGKSAGPEVSAGDKDFVKDAAIANLAEVDLGRLAVEKSSTDAVKKFARMMIDDHAKAQDALRGIASRNSIDVPAQADDKSRDEHDNLAKKQGFDFDRDYADHMVDGHQAFVDKLESRVDSKSLADWKARMQEKVTGKPAAERGEVVTVVPERSDNAVTMSLNQWAADTYPTAIAHLNAAKALKDDLKKRATN
jgi:putative membrane protein